MFGFGGASAEELERLRASCKNYVTAYKTCKQAYAGDAEKCKNLELGVLTCLSGKVCSKERHAFDTCCNRSHSSSTREGRMRVYIPSDNCEKEVQAMRKCLRRRNVWPKLEQT